MSPLESTVLDDATAQELSERLADVFRTPMSATCSPRTSSSMATRRFGGSSSRVATRSWPG